MAQLGKILIVAGSVAVMVGLLLLLGPKIPFIGRLPGDIMIKKENYMFYFPLTTSIILSALVALLFWLFRSNK